jgi:hypothetical protein
MSDTKDVATVDYQMLAEMANEVNDSNSVKIPILKINYDSNSKFKVGSWVVNQIKKEGKIIDEGEQVNQFIILKTYNRFSYFDPDNKNNSCFSNYLKNREQGEGSRFKNQCGNSCPYKNRDLKKKCDFQKVLFGIGVTSDGNKVNCVTYMKKTGYMITNEFIDENQFTKDSQGKQTPIPLFSFLTLLSTKETIDPKTNKTYYLPVFTKGKMINDIEILKKLFNEAKSIENKVEVMNNMGFNNEEYEIVDDNTTTPVEAPKTVTQEKIEIFQQQPEAPTEIKEIDPDDIFKGGFK